MENREELAKLRLRLKSIILAIAMAITGSSLTGCGNKNYERQTKINVEQESTRHFDIGEQTISVPITDDITRGNYQHTYYPGYEPVDVDINAYLDMFANGVMVYSNTEEMNLSSNTVDENQNYLYLDFGKQVDANNNEYDTHDKIKEFGVGEHIISILVNIPKDKDYQKDQIVLESHEGYKLIGISTTQNKVIALYVNTTPVKCVRVNNGYSEFGIPIDLYKQDNNYFDIGEHNILVPITEDVRSNNFQYAYHPGYEPVGINIDVDITFILEKSKFMGGFILYTNTEKVYSSSNENDFGKPLGHEDKEYDTTDGIKEFGVGEHIISIPMTKDNRYNNFYYENHDGYKIVGVEGSEINGVWYSHHFTGGVVLYVNTVPVRCVPGDNGYNLFGVPYEPDVARTRQNTQH